MSSAVDRAISVNGWPVTGVMFAKYSPYYSLEHEFLISFGVQIQLPTGNQAVEEQWNATFD